MQDLGLGHVILDTIIAIKFNIYFDSHLGQVAPTKLNSVLS